MPDVKYCTYEMKGIKSEFADWVSNISPEYTPFLSMLIKFPVKNTEFSWQTDALGTVDLANNHVEGVDAVYKELTPTTVVSNNTQILRKVVMVSDTANAVNSYGREKELFYQLKKAAKELKRDNEAIFLQRAQAKVTHSSGTPGATASFGTLIDVSMQLDVKKTAFEEDLFAATEKLFTEGSEADIIMYHPGMADQFASLQEALSPGNRQRIFKNDKRFVKEVNHLVDPLGQEYKLIPNRWCPVNTAYIFNSADVGMAVLRSPMQVELSKAGSAQKYMIEQEVGFRLSNPKAAVLVKYNPAA